MLATWRDVLNALRTLSNYSIITESYESCMTASWSDLVLYYSLNNNSCFVQKGCTAIYLQTDGNSDTAMI